MANNLLLIATNSSVSSLSQRPMDKGFCLIVSPVFFGHLLGSFAGLRVSTPVFPRSLAIIVAQIAAGMARR
jgi:hypothetical protein